MGDCGFPSHCDDSWARISVMRSYCPQRKGEIKKHLRESLCTRVLQCIGCQETFSYKIGRTFLVCFNVVEC